MAGEFDENQWRGSFESDENLAVRDARTTTVGLEHIVLL